MDDYACDAWTCPICSMPLTVVGGREVNNGAKYLKLNPQLQTCVTSMQSIVDTLNSQAPPEWWSVGAKNTQTQEEQEGQEDYHTSPEDRKGDDDESPMDSEKTEVFPPTQLQQQQQQRLSPPTWMDAIADASSPEASPLPASRSLALPSESPSMSPIAHMSSQASMDDAMRGGSKRSLVDTNDDGTSSSKRSSIVRFQDQVQAEVEKKEPAVPTVLVASELSPSDRKMINAFAKRNQIKLLSSSGEADLEFDYALCGNAEMETGDGFLVSRSFGYLLAVASGKPVVNVSYFAKQTNVIRRALQAPSNNCKDVIIGDVESTEWMAPQRAMEMKQSGSQLLEKTAVLVTGEFDKIEPTKSSESVYTRERIELLLQSSGAQVIDLESFNSKDQLGENVDKVVVLVRPDCHPRDWRFARKDMADSVGLQQLQTTLQPLLVCGNWLLDSIGDFRVKDLDQYTQAQFRK
jgi:hypothetical protein